MQRTYLIKSWTTSSVMEQPSSRSTKSGTSTSMLADRKYVGIDRSALVLKGEVSAHSDNPRLLFARTKT